MTNLKWSIIGEYVFDPEDKSNYYRLDHFGPYELINQSQKICWENVDESYTKHFDSKEELFEYLGSIMTEFITLVPHGKDAEDFDRDPFQFREDFDYHSDDLPF